MADMGIPPPPDESTLYGNSAPSPPPAEGALFGNHGTATVPPPPSEADLFHVPTAQRVNTQGQHPNALQAGIMDLTNSAPWKDMTGAFQNASLTGFGGFVARHLYSDVLGVPKDQVNAAVASARQDAGQQQQQNAQNIPGTHIDPLAIGSGLIGGADPTLAIPIPGLGAIAGKIATKGLAGVAARVGVSAAAHGAYGSAADAAYQGADMLDGLQKDFDVQRNLHAAATMATLGGTGAGLHEASPFIQTLFKQRNGLDTTPSENPAGTTNPLSGEQGMSPEQTAQYHEVLKSGNESDIHNFFNGKNIVPPAHADIHEWVSRRDDVANNVAPADYADPMFHPEPGPADLRQAVSDHIAQHTANWKNAPEYEVINHTDDIADPAVREAASREGANDPDALGFVGPDNKVRIFASKIDSPETLNAVLYHESLGHFGLAQKFGDRLDGTIQTLLDRNVGQFGRDVDAWQKENLGAYGGDRIRAAEEVLANQSNKGVIKPSVSDAITSNIRQFGRRMGMKLSYSDGEIRQIMSMAHDAVINGKGRDVRANGFKPSPAYQPMDLSGNDTPGGANKYMFTGPKAATFDPHMMDEAQGRLDDGRDPNETRKYTGVHYASDGQPRMEISDDGSYLKHDPETEAPRIYDKGTNRLADVLHHPRLYQAYPELRDMPVKSRELPGGLSGGYDPEAKTIHIDNRLPEMHSTLLHEVQHAVQHIEGQIKSDDTNVHLSDADYRDSALEREARSTEDRKDLSGLDRANSAMPKFMRRSDLAASKDYVANDLDGIYKALDRGYVPETRSFDEVRRSALEAGFSPSQIKDLADVGDLSTKLYRLQSAANMADQKLAALHERLGTDKWTMDDQGNYLTTLADRDYLVQRIKGNRAEIARALNISKAASSYSLSTMKAVADKLREEGSGLAGLADDPIKFMKFAQQIKALFQQGNPVGAHVAIAGVNKPYWEQYINSFHFNAMLSALSTHVKAPIDMGTGLLRDVLEKAVAIPIGAVRHAITGGERGVTPTELAAHTYGGVKAMMNLEVYKNMAKAAGGGSGGFVGPDGTFHPVNMMNQYGSVSNPDLGPVLSLPSHLVAAQDTFFRSSAMQSNMYSYGIREAQKALGPHAPMDQVMTMASSLALNPTQAMLDFAKAHTDRSLLLNNNPLNNFITKARTYGPNMTPWQRVTALVTNTLAPFIRVESNSLINRFVQRSPLALLDPYTVRVLKAGGPEADIALAKIAYGTTTLAMAWAAAGKLTGNVSPDANKRAELLAAGELPKAVHENGQYDQSSNLAMSVFPWDQHNATAQIVKSARDAFESKGATPAQKMVGLKLALESVLHNMADMSWVADAAPGIDALTSNETEGPGKVARFVGDTAKTFVPNILNQTERLTDKKRDARPDDPTNITGQIVNDVKSAIPGLASTLPEHYSVYGRPLETGATPEGIHNWLGSGNNVKDTADPTEHELNRLAGLTKAAIVTPTQKSIKGKGWPSAIKLTTAQAEEYQMYAGQAIVGSVKDQMDSGAWAQMSDRDRIATVRSIQTQAKAQVREALIDKPGWFNDDQLSTLRSQLSGTR